MRLGTLVQYRDATGHSWPAVVVRVVAGTSEAADRRSLDLRVMCDSDSLLLRKGVARCPEGDELPNAWSPWQP
jgi:hypothetical protein